VKLVFDWKADSLTSSPRKKNRFHRVSFTIVGLVSRLPQFSIIPSASHHVEEKALIVLIISR